MSKTQSYANWILDIYFKTTQLIYKQNCMKILDNQVTKILWIMDRAMFLFVLVMYETEGF